MEAMTLEGLDDEPHQERRSGALAISAQISISGLLFPVRTTAVSPRVAPIPVGSRLRGGVAGVP